MVETPFNSSFAPKSGGETDTVSDDDPGPSCFSVLIECDDWHAIEDAQPAVRRAYAACVAALPSLAGREVTFLLADDATIAELNGQYRGKPAPTNVLSFPAAALPADAGPQPLGDIIVAYETVVREAREEGKSVPDHLAHLTVHGLLHLAGYDHETDDEAEHMEAFEREILAAIGIADPYSGSSAEAAPNT